MIRQLVEDDAERYSELRRRALAEAPLAFAASPEDDFVGSAAAVREQLRRGPGWAILGAFAEAEALVGTVGLVRDRLRKAAHKAHLWGMYVAPGHRGHGVGAALVEAALAHARSLPGVSWVHLSVSAAAPEARRLYERAGFRRWGTEPEALRHDGRSADEHHLALRLG